MRSLLAGERTTIAAARVQHLLKVEITDADGVYRDYSSYVITAKWGETIDQAVAQATITLRRAEGTSSLAPTMVGSPLNRNAAMAYAAAIDLARLVRISTATINPGDTPSYREMFLGRIDENDWAADPIQLTCSDLGAFLVDTQIEAENDYWSNDGTTANSAATGGAHGTTVPVAVETVIQKIIADWPNGITSPVLYTPTSPVWLINAYKQSKVKVFEAIQALALQIGWDLRYRYDASHVSRLTLLDPSRTSTTVAATIGPTEYSDVKKLDVAMADVRNAGLVGYLDTGGKLNTVSYSDAASIAKFGRRYMELAPGDNINTSSDASRYLQASINDLSGAPAEQDVETLYFWPVQLYDRYVFSANGDHYDTDQTLSVVGYEHAFEKGQGVTTLTCAGRVIGSFAEWLRRSHGATPEEVDLSILRWSQTESPDKTLAFFSLVAGAAVEAVHTHFRTVAIDADGDTTNFSGDEDVTESPTLLIARVDANRNASFTIPNPLRNFKIAGRMVPVNAALVQGEQIPFYVFPAPPALNAKLRTARVGALGSLSIDVAFGPSDIDPLVGILVEVIQNSLTVETTILSRRLVAPATIDSTTDRALGNIVLPGGADYLEFRVKLTDVSGQPWWFGPANLTRDPVSDATATLLNYRAGPAAIITFGPDTDAVRVTSHDGVTTTWNSAALLAATSPVTYTVGLTVRDDASTEPVLIVDDTRSGFKVEAQGGGTWTTILGPTDLHGQPKNPPTALITTTPNTNGTAEDVTVTPNTATTEKLHVYFRDGADTAAIQWYACAGASDPTKISVTAGTVLGPANFFARVDGVGSPTAKLSALAAANDQLTRYAVMIEGAESGIQSAWLPVTISLMAKPWNQSVDATFIAATGNLHVVLVTGARCLFETVDIADNAAFTSPTTQTAVPSGTPGQQIAFDFALGLAQHGKTYYVRAKPNNKATGLGLDGDYQTATVDVGAIFDCQPSYAETVTQGTVTLVITDPASALNLAAVDGSITAAISWHVTKLGVTTIEASTTVPGGGATSGTYTKAIALDPLHTISVSAFVHLKDGSTKPFGPWPFDSNKISDLDNSDSAVSGSNAATVDFTLQWDTDTLVGSNCARYSLNAGASWTTVTVTSGLLSQFSIVRTGSVQSMLIQALNVIDGNWGNQSTLKVPIYLAEGPSVTAHFELLTSTTGRVVWSCNSGTPLLQIDNGAASTPSASPIAVTLDGNTHSYLFTASLAGQTVPAPVTVPAQASSGSGGTFTTLSAAVHSTGAGTSSIRVTFAFSAGSPSFDVYTNDPGFTGDPSGNTYVVASGGSGVSSPFDAPVTEKLSPNPLGTGTPVDIGFFVVASSGVSEVGRSTKNVQTYQVDL